MVLLLVLAGSASAEEHVVQAGETAYGIAHRYGIPVATLLSVNHILHPRDLRVGAVLTIPSLYVVKRGDTLYGIAQRFDVRLQTLLSANHLTASRILEVGERLIIPEAHAAAPRQTPNAATPPSVSPQTPASTSAAPSSPSGLNPGPPDGSPAAASPFWPHPGRRVLLSGKLAGGAQIWGNVGDPILSVSTGRVVWVGPYRGYGRVVFVQSPQRYIYVYGGGERTLVHVGEQVSPGTEVAQMGLNPRVGQASTYFFVYRDGKPVNPATAPRG